MSSKKKYEVFSEEPILFKPLETKRIMTNIVIEPSENECLLFNASEDLFLKHGIVSVQNFIETEINERLFLRFIKICPIQVSNIEVSSIYEQTFGVNNEFKLPKGTLLGKITLLKFD